jgi:hypothetical protein
MGINIGIGYEDSECAGCGDLRRQIIRVRVKEGSGLDDILEKERVVPIEKAMEAVQDWDDFAERNSLDPSEDFVYISSLKKADRKILEPLAEESVSGWASLEGLSASDREKAISAAEESMTGWDMISFDDMSEICGKCPLSWDKGRGCIGAFGPDNSLLPQIAEKYGCEIVASVPESAKSGRRFARKDADKLLKECGILREKLPEEGKMAVRRYAGPVERMEAAAKACIHGRCGFYFF